jgi:hypothetical protein
MKEMAKVMDKEKVKIYRRISREMSQMPKLSIVPNKKRLLIDKYKDTESAQQIEEYLQEVGRCPGLLKEIL